MTLYTKTIGKFLLSFFIVMITGCDFSSPLSGRWIHKDQAIAFELFKSGDILIDAPCFNQSDVSGKYEVLDSDSFKLDFKEESRIYSFSKNANGFGLSGNTQGLQFSGEYISEEVYLSELSKRRKPRKSELNYWHTENKISDGNYEYIGVDGDKGWKLAALTQGNIRGDFHGCNGGYPLKKGKAIFGSNKEFNRDTYIKILSSNTDESLHFLKRFDIDKGALGFRYIFDGFDNDQSLETQQKFLKKYNRGCLYSYGTPIVYQRKSKSLLYIPRRCGSSQADFIVAKIWKQKSGKIKSNLKLVNIPHFGRYWKTDCSPSYYFTDVGEKKVNLRLVFTTEYGQSYSSKANGDCGSPDNPQFVKEVELEINI